MKKNTLVKILGIAYLVLIVLTWIIPIGTASEGTFTSSGTVPMGIIDIFRMPILTLATFVSYAIYFLAVGGMYGVLNKTGVYSSIVNGIVKNWKGKEKSFIIIVATILVILGSLTGLSTLLFITVPFLVAILLLMGFPKILALVSTVGSILVGEIASTYGFSGSGYTVNSLGIGINEGILVKIALLIMILGLFITFICIKLKNFKKPKKVVEKIDTKATKKDSKKSTTKADLKKEIVIEEKQPEAKIPLYEDTKETNKSKLPLIIVSIVFFVIAVVGLYNWNYGLGVTFFDKMLEGIKEFKIGEYALFANLLGNVSGMGYWGTYDLVLLIVVFTLLIKWLYSIKFSTMIDGFKNGMKQMIKVVFYVLIVNVIFTVMLNLSETTLFASIANYLSTLTKGFNIFTTSLMSIIGSLFYNDYYYLLSDVSSILTAYETTLLPTIGILVQSIFGTMMLILPTSILVIAGLSYLDVSYKEWFKYMWKFILAVLGVVLAVVIVMIVIL